MKYLVFAILSAAFAALPATQPAPDGASPAEGLPKAGPPILHYTLPTAGLESQLRDINRKLDAIDRRLDQIESQLRDLRDLQPKLDQIESQLRGLRDLQPKLDRIQRDLDWQRLQPRR